MNGKGDVHRNNGMKKYKRKEVLQKRSGKGMLEVLCVEEMNEMSKYIRKEEQKKHVKNIQGMEQVICIKRQNGKRTEGQKETKENYIRNGKGNVFRKKE